jgi:hypothetical protein
MVNPTNSRPTGQGAQLCRWRRFTLRAAELISNKMLQSTHGEERKGNHLCYFLLD